MVDKNLQDRSTPIKAVYAGSFDPVTNGHLWMMQEGSYMFDNLIVAVGINPAKASMFSLEERISMIAQVTKDCPNIEIDSFDFKYLVQYAKSKDAKYLIRGIRNNQDYEYERAMRYINEDIINFSNGNEYGITTIFLIPPRKSAEISSSLVKGLIGPEGWQDVIKKYVPEEVYQMFADRFGK
ncbi:MAG: pantetheine-phosphate adenylyltransferase [archaeon]